MPLGGTGFVPNFLICIFGFVERSSSFKIFASNNSSLDILVSTFLRLGLAEINLASIVLSPFCIHPTKYRIHSFAAKGLSEGCDAINLYKLDAVGIADLSISLYSFTGRNPPL